MPVLGRLARLSISSLTLPALFEKLECELSDLLMHLCAVDSVGVAAYINQRLPAQRTFSQKCTRLCASAKVPEK
jgi:hypothetical protein